MAPPPTDIGADPAPTSWDGLVLPYDRLDPYSKYAVVSSPFEFTVPFSVAPAAPMPLAAWVVGSGGTPCRAPQKPPSSP